ncbi:MAG: hypothetical protein DCC45_08690 [Armatimonadetes bacterium]|nr:MAG: hypothetical protein DCC45_08690 [Armatimonadota bacterium]
MLCALQFFSTPFGPRCFENRGFTLDRVLCALQFFSTPFGPRCFENRGCTLDRVPCALQFVSQALRASMQREPSNYIRAGALFASVISTALEPNC